MSCPHPDSEDGTRGNPYLQPWSEKYIRSRCSLSVAAKLRVVINGANKKRRQKPRSILPLGGRRDFKSLETNYSVGY